MKSEHDVLFLMRTTDTDSAIQRPAQNSSSRKQGSATNPKTSAPTMSPSYTFQVNRSGKPVNYHKQQAGRSQAAVHESPSMGFKTNYGDTCPAPLPAHMSASGSDASFFTAPQQGPLQSLGYASQSLGPRSFEHSSQASSDTGPQYAPASISSNLFYSHKSGNSNDSVHHLSFPTDQYSHQSLWNPCGADMNGQQGYFLSPASTHPQQASSDQGYTPSSFGDVDYSGRDMLLPDSYNVNQQINAPRNSPVLDSSTTFPPPSAPQPISTRDPTPPSGYMFSSAADLQAAVENDPQRVYNYIRKLYRENIRLQETLGRSKQQTKDEEDRDKRHVAVMERAWDNLSAALVQVNPALANTSGPATRASSGAQVAQAGGPNQAGMPPPARGRGTGRGGSAGRGGGLRLDDAAGQELPAGPRRSTRRSTRSDKAAGNTRIGNTGAADNDDEENDDL